MVSSSQSVRASENDDDDGRLCARCNNLRTCVVTCHKTFFQVVTCHTTLLSQPPYPTVAVHFHFQQSAAFFSSDFSSGRAAALAAMRLSRDLKNRRASHPLATHPLPSASVGRSMPPQRHGTVNAMRLAGGGAQAPCGRRVRGSALGSCHVRSKSEADHF
jgi:hypothetical protein